MLCVPSQIEPTWQEKMPIRQQARKHRPHALHLSTTSCQDSCYTRVFHTCCLHSRSYRTCTWQGVESPFNQLEAILAEEHDHRVFAAHSSFGWSAGERRRFEIKEPFLECGDAAPTTEPQLKGKQVVEECLSLIHI